MPNYRYQPQDCQRRPGCGCPPQMTKRQPDMAACAGNEHPSRPLADRSIAMAYVPWQQWARDIGTGKRLSQRNHLRGTEQTIHGRETLMADNRPCRRDLRHYIDVVSFAADDVKLFLDTPPGLPGGAGIL